MFLIGAGLIRAIPFFVNFRYQIFDACDFWGRGRGGEVIRLGTACSSRLALCSNDDCLLLDVRTRRQLMTF